MIRLSGPGVKWQEDHQARTVAMNVGGRYVTLVVELLLGVVMLPVNLRHLGQSNYGLWMLAASIVAYFPVFELGYAAAMERFVAHYRTQRDAAAINEIASTLVFVFAAFGLTAVTVVAIGAWHLDYWFNLTPTQARTGGIVLLFVAGQFAFGLPFAIFGAVVNGFQRTILNSVVGTAVALAVAMVNVAVVLAGGGLIALVGLMAATRMLGYIAYRLNAYRVFPLLQIRPSLFRLARLREVTGFGAFMLIQDVSNRMNYASDPMVIAAFLSTGAVAVWTVAQRLADVVMQLTNQLNEVLFSIVVDCDSGQRDERLRDVLVQGTRISLATSVPLAGTLALLAGPVVIAWTGARVQFFHRHRPDSGALRGRARRKRHRRDRAARRRPSPAARRLQYGGCGREYRPQHPAHPHPRAAWSGLRDTAGGDDTGCHGADPRRVRQGAIVGGAIRGNSRVAGGMAGAARARTLRVHARERRRLVHPYSPERRRRLSAVRNRVHLRCHRSTGQKPVPGQAAKHRGAARTGDRVTRIRLSHRSWFVDGCRESREVVRR